MNQSKTAPLPLKSHLTSPVSFTFLTTEDGSPTVRFGAGEGSSEAMHSLRGAYSETRYIYGAAIERALELGFEPTILCLGLGLGYVEIMAAGLILKYAKSLQADSHGKAEIRSQILNRARGQSFELFPQLREWFSNWALGQGDLPPEFQKTYDEITAFTSRDTGVEAIEIRSFMGELIKSGRWLLRAELQENTSFESEFGVICFDAFSSKTSPELWTEDFIISFLTKVAASGSMLSSYACTGSLKRALKKCGFHLLDRDGFSGKRASTFALKDLKTSVEKSDDVVCKSSQSKSSQKSPQN